MEIKSRIIKTEDVNWRDLEWLQDNLKEMKKADFEKLKQSLKVNSFIMPFHVWQQNGTTWILDGHHRKKAMEELAKEGIDIPKKLPATFIRVKNEKEAKKLVLIYSSIYARATDEGLYEYINANDLNFDDLKLEIDLPDFNLDRFETGYMTDEPVEDEPPPLPEVAKTKTGDLYELGQHRLLCGDSTVKANVERLMAGKLVDMVFTDPPYGVDYGKKNRFLNSFQKAGRNLNDIANDMLGKDELLEFLTKAFTLAYEYGADHCSYYVTAPQGGELGLMMMMMMMMSGLPTRHVLIWNKNRQNFSLGRLDYEYKHEPILFTWKKTHKFYGGGECKSSVWDINKEIKCGLHPTMKPVALITNALLNSSKKDDICADIFLGSGSTLIACEQTKRICYGMEIAPVYCDVIVTRYCNFVKDNKIKLNGKAIAWK